ncbi:cytochrome c assembly protein [Desulfarculus baarsii DSM 2075]|uniref:Cytochrome c assembly protein n=1 Tax=Desulfarculus baarsii (strain ATCC 33931 / DSM 2075 / LMG 7858 / VKM B-1802 / 2st14) TaxID=644282 RepID=E1QDS0_DESB2|nr:cytochrome c biogenesis protein CcsA [Desulfarculus baarsii]ADK83706.1 cytochrome c assembly protein [Desulfarculus baarsii DSM 2075]
MNDFLHWATVAAYLAGTALYLAFVAAQRDGLRRVGGAVLWLGLGLHTAGLATAWWELGVVPALNLGQSLALLSWALMAATLVANLRLEIMVMGALSGPICTMLLLAGNWLPAPVGQPGPVFKSVWLGVHVFGLLGGYGLLLLACLAGLLYMRQERALRSKRLGPLFQRLPSLSRLDQFGHWTMVSGFTLMTVGLVGGAIFAHGVMGSFLRGTPKEVCALVTWLAYAAVIHTRLVQGWRGRRGAWLMVAAFGLVLFTFVGAGLLFNDYHSFESIIKFTGAVS